MKVIVAGANGFVGQNLCAALAGEGHEVLGLVRHRPTTGLGPGIRGVQWDGRSPDGAWAAELAGAGAVVNLAGASIGARRWTSSRKAELLASRIVPTDALVGAIAAAPEDRRPRALVSMSGIDFYGDRPAAELIDEGSPPGETFLARLCGQWEAAARAAEPVGVRVVRLRTALVVGRGAPALGLLSLPFRLFVGGPLGSGRQPFTWIHLDDLIGLIQLAIVRADLAGPINAVAPDIRPQRDAARDVGAVLHRPAVMPMPALVLRLALGEQADLLLHGRQAIPRRALEAGYQFRYPDLRPALAEAFGR